MKRREFIQVGAAAGIFTLIGKHSLVQLPARAASTGLEKAFLEPGLTARPGNIWQWMNGHVSREGITLDLEAMKRIGIGAVYNFDAGTGIPKGPVVYRSEEWFALKAHALKECERLGLEYTLHNCPGWSSSGGPWITPELSMKTIVWRELILQGGSKQKVKIPQPEIKLDFYRDIIVLAYPTRNDNGSPFTDYKKKTNQEFSVYGTNPLPPQQAGIPLASLQLITTLPDVENDIELDLPAGEWTVIRFGYSSLGTENRSAPDTGIGLECDKYDVNAIRFHFDKMMTSLLPQLQSLAADGRVGLEIDSYEVGMQNWTAGFEKIFEERNGYSLLPYLPAMAGKLVESGAVTDAFLWDLRRTQADLLSENYYNEFVKLCHEQQLKAIIEPYDRGMMEEMQIGAQADMLLGEYWNGLSIIFQNNLTMRRTCKLVSSIAHTNGQKIIGVEGLTAEPQSGAWQEYPFAMKPICDKIFTMGINRILFHRNAHQPHPTAAPGMTMGPWGIQFDRTNTLWNASKEWMTYLSRCQSLLQQGLFVADFAYFTGEEPAVYTTVNREELKPALPAGFDYDLINKAALSNARIVDSKLQLPDGMEYRVLVLQEYSSMSIELLEKLLHFTNQGLLIFGQPPTKLPGMAALDALKQKRFTELVAALWDGKAPNRIRRTAELNWFVHDQMIQDFYVRSVSGDAAIRYLHRVDGTTDFYFICNQRRSDEQLTCSFRVSGRKPEIWDPLTGTMNEALLYEERNGITQVALSLPAYGSVFVVFRKASDNRAAVSVRRNGKAFFSFQQEQTPLQFPKPVKNNFSIALYAKPELNIMLQTDAFYEHVQHPWTDFYAIYPETGSRLYGNGAAIAGLTVGRNGVAVWENESGIPVFNFSVKKPISGWTHIMLVYREGIPEIYINGRLAGSGTKKWSEVYYGPSVCTELEKASWYNGDLCALQYFDRAIDAAAIKELAAQPVPGYYPVLEEIKPLINKNQQVHFGQNGNYQLDFANGKAQEIRVRDLAPPYVLPGPWTLRFPENSGAPQSGGLAKLISLKDHSEADIRHFSGTVNYQTHFALKQDDLKKGIRFLLDLGRVEVIASVIVNGKKAGTCWTRPYRLDITDLIHAGINELQVEVTNQWVNRLIGDESFPDTNKYVESGGGPVFGPLVVGAIEELPEWYLKREPQPAGPRVAFSTWKHHHHGDPLLEAGLLGPVLLVQVAQHQLTSKK